MYNIHARVMARPWTEEEFADLLAQEGSFALMVSCVEGHMDGFILCRMAGGESEILTLAVSPESQGQGVGKALVSAALAIARGRGAEAMFLEVAEDNAPAVAVYERAGFEQVGTRPDYYRSGHHLRKDALVMRRDLA